MAGTNDVPNGMWDELRLLLATDDVLHDELTAVCDILEGDSPDEASDTASLSELTFVSHPDSPMTSSTSSTTNGETLQQEDAFDSGRRRGMAELSLSSS
ncbi:hypothetical protein Ae201684P_021529 [Aphanomyces euteiches]|nr:hypothetical protein Ae201684P_021529 [Aphanomyces euteiches]